MYDVVSLLGWSPAQLNVVGIRLIRPNPITSFRLWIALLRAMVLWYHTQNYYTQWTMVEHSQRALQYVFFLLPIDSDDASEACWGRRASTHKMISTTGVGDNEPELDDSVPSAPLEGRPPWIFGKSNLTELRRRELSTYRWCHRLVYHPSRSCVPTMSHSVPFHNRVTKSGFTNDTSVYCLTYRRVLAFITHKSDSL
jgi:hypothetical protein